LARFAGIILTIAVTALLMLGGCASSSYSQLVSEDDIPELASLKAEGRVLPNHTTLVTTHGFHGPDVKVAVHEIDCPVSDDLIIMVHGVFSDHSSWRFIQGELLKNHDVWLIDLPGCGDSDKPDPEVMGPDGYSPPALAERLLEAIDTRLQSRGGDGKFTLVGHSLGGTIIMRMFTEERLCARFGGVLARAQRLVLLAPMDATLNKPDPTFQQIATAGGLTISLGSAFGVIREKVSESTISGSPDPKRALREDADLRIRYLENSETRRALQAMLSQATHWTENNRPNWEANEAVVASYCVISPPCLIIWGERDEVLPCSMGYKLAAQLPNAQLVCLPKAMHSPEIEQPATVAAIIRQFADEGTVPQIQGAHGAPARTGRTDAAATIGHEH
jgi:pimeloyl-ACP methyl ester carboxylesterase